MTELTSPRWAAFERCDGSWEVLDHTTSTAYTVAAQIGEHLWQSTELWPLPLHQALDAAAGEAATTTPPSLDPGGQHAFLDLELADTVVRYLTCEPVMLEHLRTAFAVAVPQQRRTAEVVCRLDSSARLDLLHRSMSTDRTGVHYRLPHETAWQPLTGELPGLPPLATPPYRGRFFALHAALLVLPSGRSLLVCGNQKAGKTTAALWARDAGLAAIATDELVLVDARTGTAFGVPLPTAVRADGRRTSIPLSGATTHLGAALPTAAVVLSPSQQSTLSSVTTARTADEALDWLGEHIRDAGASPAATRLAARRLLTRLPVHRLSVSPWPGLQSDLDRALAPLIKTLEHS